MAIAQLEFGKNLRPSTVDAMNKINEIITAVNALDPQDVTELQSDVQTLKSQMTTANENISTIQSETSQNTQNITTLTGTVNTNTEDISNIKTTLYTPLESAESE